MSYIIYNIVQGHVYLDMRTPRSIFLILVNYWVIPTISCGKNGQNDRSNNINEGNVSNKMN